MDIYFVVRVRVAVTHFNMKRSADAGDECKRKIPKLKELSADQVPGFTRHWARLWVKEGDDSYLNLIQNFETLAAQSNVKGRVPSSSCSQPRSSCTWWKCPEKTRTPQHSPHCVSYLQCKDRERAHGENMMLARRTGKACGIARIARGDENGVMVRVDSIVFPEMWLEINHTQC